MSIEVRVDGSLINGTVDVPEGMPGFVTAAERGAIGIGGVQIEDLDGVLNPEGWQTITVDDTLATPTTRVFTGFVYDRGIGRLGKARTGASRVHDCTVVDLNSLLHLKLNRFIDNDAKRLAETDVARVAWLLTSRALAGLVTDEGFVSAANAGSFLASDCRRRYADDVLSEMAPSAVKNFYVYRDESSGNAALAYQRDQDTYWAASFGLSNVKSEEDFDTVFFPSLDAVLNRTPENRFTGVDYSYANGNVWMESASILTALGMNREAVYDTPRVGLHATALVTSAQWLNVRSAEEDTITVTVEVPSTHINRALAGQEMDVKFTHLDGYESGTTTRIRRRNARPLTRGRWSVTFELWVKPTPVDDATQGGDCPTTASVARLMSENEGFPNGPTHYEVVWLDDGDSPGGGQPSEPLVGLMEYVQVGSENQGVKMLGAGTITIEMKASFAGVESGDQVFRWQVLKNGVEVLFQQDSSSGGLRFVSSECDIEGDVAVVVDDVISAFLYAPNAISILTIPAGVGGSDHRLRITGELADCEDPEVPLPSLGEEIGSEDATGDTDNSNQAFTTAGGFIPGSLRVLHDGIDQSNHIATQDAAAGTFVLDYAPSFGSTIRTYYTSA